MSSLAGALGETAYHRRSQGEDQASNASGSDDDEEMGDLFGNDDDVEDFHAEKSPASPTASGPGSERLTSPEREHREALEYGEHGHAQDLADMDEVKEAEVAFPNIPVPRSSDGDNWVIRTPNYVTIDSKPFHPDTYIEPDQEDEETQGANAKERSMTIKLKVENALRWRWTKDENGMDKRQSNARIIRWSDGSLSLRLGKELFDINKSVDTSAAAPRQLGASSQPSSQPKASPQMKSQGLTYLVAQHKRSQVLQSEAVITGFMSLRPTGMQSETHRMLVRAVGQKHSKVARLRLTEDPSQDPEREKAELLKQSTKKSRKREPDDGLGGGRRRRYSRRTADTDVWSDDEDEGVGVWAGSDDEDDRRRSPKKGKRKAEDEEGAGGYQEDDFLVADDSEEEGNRSKKRKKDEYEEEDPLDRLEAKIEAQERSKNRADSDDEKEDAMDVESEEEDDEDVPVRRTAGGSRRRAINFDEEEE
ncbi:hypothetical protein EST38_g1949 [Candolleomyces aberdarensis]|uniref:RNA polymerase-associated protein LEO1 n=1 Tax=Candolleomyces aberdarensis TaxID=2316362 RepID=A0A4Q2DX98_9AGAR|nr:hypothetical protein EST38_g1949 [Candolleomyces aberdarensis]